uniref:Uncharacterized protein n=1 Tax=Picea sitchensis TaxID=3332 RepID=D5AB43_PICSI|nr:unknown [Picea sitchensis]
MAICNHGFAISRSWRTVSVFAWLLFSFAGFSAFHVKCRVTDCQTQVIFIIIFFVFLQKHPVFTSRIFCNMST